MKTSRILAVAIPLLGLAFAPAKALEIEVLGVTLEAGSTGNGGTGVTVGTGDTSAGATVGGGSNVASAGAGTGGQGVNAGIGTGGGPLVSAASAGGNTTANVNLGLGGAGGGTSNTVNGVSGPLGELLGALPPGGGGGGPGGGVSPAAAQQFAVIFAGFSGAERQDLKIRCSSILRNQQGFDPALIKLCRMVASAN